MRSVVVDVVDSKTRQAIARMLRAEGWEASVLGASACETRGGLDGGAESSGVVVCAAERTGAHIRHPARTVVVASSAEDALRSALEIGATEAVAWPGEQKLLLTAVERAAEPGDTRGEGASRIAFASVRSCGATTLVAHVALALNRRGRDAILFDCDSTFGDLTGYLLDAEPGISLEEAIEAGASVRSVAVEAKGLSLVPARGGCLAGGGSHAGALDEWIMSQAMPAESLCLFDIPAEALVTRFQDGLSPRSWLDLAVLLVPLDFAGIRRARMLLDAWPGGDDEQLRILLVQRRRHGIAPADALEALGKMHFGMLPLGGEALGEATDQGRLLGARPGTPYGRVVDALAARLIESCRVGSEQPRSIRGSAPETLLRAPGLSHREAVPV